MICPIFVRKVFIMKKILYIFAVIFGLSVVSCQKQDIKPIADNGVEIPTWESSQRSGDTDEDDIDTHGNTNSDSGSSSGHDITDPNNDPDGNDNDITDPNTDPDGNGKKGKN